MSKKKLLVITLIVIAVAGASFYSYKRWWTKEDSPHIFVSGNIEATEVKVSFKIPGKILKRLVDEGNVVKEGDLIAKLEDRELIDQKNKAESSLETLQAKVPALLTTIEKEEKTSFDEINKAESSLRAAQARLAELLSGSRPQ